MRVSGGWVKSKLKEIGGEEGLGGMRKGRYGYWGGWVRKVKDNVYGM